MRTLFLLVLLYPLLGAAQDYIPMLQEGNTWSVDVEYVDPMPPNDCCLTITHQVNLGNTEIINGKVYYRLIVDENERCLLREEDGFVYKYDESNNIDRLLFDFTLEVGDIFNLNGSAYDEGAPCIPTAAPRDGIMEVVEISTQFIAGADRKVIIFNEPLPPSTYITWIEGIGNISGIDSIFGTIDGSSPGVLVCFSNNGETYFMNGATSCDNTTLGLDELSKEEIILYPNPVTSVSVLQIPKSFQADLLLVYDVSGKLVKEIVLDGNTHIINTMEYASGLYFYKLIENNQVLVSNKFIIK